MENKYSDGKNQVAWLDNSQNTHYQYTKVVWLIANTAKKLPIVYPLFTNQVGKPVFKG